jgi:hypothetical protein
MELKKIDPFRLKSSTPLGDVRSYGFSGNGHGMEHAVFRCGEDVLPERIRCEELALQEKNVSLRNDTTWCLTNSEDFRISVVIRHVKGREAARYM